MWVKIKKNLFFKILAVVIAILTWFIVSVNNNPIEVKIISVPIQIQNENNLTLRNLKIVNGFDSFIDIQVKGATAEVHKVNASDFSAYVDYVEISDESVKKISVKSIDYKGDANITYSYKEEDAKKDINVERLISSEFPVTVEFSGSLPEGYSLVSYFVTPNIQSINGGDSMISSIDSVKVNIDLNNAVQSFTLRKACVVYDKNAKVINEYANTITVDISVVIGKIVKTATRLTGTTNLGDDHMYIASALEYGQAIVVGDEATIKIMETIFTKTLDISGRTESFSTQIEFDVPSNIKIYTMAHNLNANNMVGITVNIEQLTTKKFEYSIEELVIRNKSILQQYTVKESVFTVTLKGRASTMALISKEQITPNIDVLKLKDGVNAMKVNILSMGNNIVLAESSVLTVYVETIAVYAIDANRIILTNIDNTYSYAIQTETFNIRLVGLGSDISNADISNLKFYVNVQNLTRGMHLIDVIIKDGSLPFGVRLYEDIKIAVMITKQ